MTTWTLVHRSLRYFWRTHLGVLLGVIVATAVLVGALVVGDSVRLSLREIALTRLGNTHLVLAPHDRFFSDQLAQRIGKQLNAPYAPVVYVPGTAVNQASDLKPHPRANQIEVYGVDDRFWSQFPYDDYAGDALPRHPRLSPGEVAINAGLAERLKVEKGDEILIRVAKPSLLPRDAPLTRKGVADVSVALRVTVNAVVADAQAGRFSLRANQSAPLNAFVDQDWLRHQIEQVDKSNLMLVGDATPEAAADAIAQQWRLQDVGLEVRKVPDLPLVELRTNRIFLEEEVVKAADKAAIANGRQSVGVLTYMVNGIRAGDRETPYSMATAVGINQITSLAQSVKSSLPQSFNAIIPAEDHEVVINDWLANDLQVQVGDAVSLAYFVVGDSGDLVEVKSEAMKVGGIVSIEGIAADKSWLPDFPDIPEEGATLSSWKPSFQKTRSINDEDDEYWKAHRGTPKLFLTLEQGRTLWRNRFGSTTAVRIGVGDADANELVQQFADSIRKELDPESIGFAFIDVRGNALNAASGGFDFAQLFLGFSFFLIVAALLLTGMLFVFAIEQRVVEVGTLLAMGFRPKQVRRLLLIEGLMLAMLGAVIGVIGGVLYTHGLLWGLSNLWQEAVGDTSLSFHVMPTTLVIGWASSVFVAMLTMGIVLRRQAKRSARELIAGGGAPESGAIQVRSGRVALAVGLISSIAAVGLLASVGIGRGTQNAGAFFGGGSLLLIGGLAFTRFLLLRLAAAGTKEDASFTSTSLGTRNTARRRGRSLATVGLLACGSFLVIAIGAFWLDPNTDSDKRSGGTGGFELWAESSLPVLFDLNTEEGLDKFAMLPDDLPGVRFVPMKVRDGDDASCLNLNRAQSARLVGLDPTFLAKEHAFTFTSPARKSDGIPADDPWNLLATQTDADVVPAIGDQNTIVYGLGQGMGSEFEYTDEAGRTFKVKIVAMLSNSVLQGSLFIHEDVMKHRYPSVSGHKQFLIDVPADKIDEVRETLGEYMSDVGMNTTPTVDRLRVFLMVQNTYLGIFQLLGGLGLLLGSIGLGVVVLRNVLERRSELAVLTALGFAKRRLIWMVLREHWLLLVLGLICGVTAAVIAVLPALLAPGAEIPIGLLSAIIAGVLISGVIWTWLATSLSLRGSLLGAIRDE